MPDVILHIERFICRFRKRQTGKEGIAAVCKRINTAQPRMPGILRENGACHVAAGFIRSQPCGSRARNTFRQAAVRDNGGGNQHQGEYDEHKKSAFETFFKHDGSSILKCKKDNANTI